MNVRLLLLLSAMLLGATACTQVPQWTLFYVSDQDKMPEGALAPHIAGYYEQLEQCLAKGAGMVKLSQSGKGSYQCGYECKDDQAGDVQCARFERVPAL
ncbi:hypothetical protein K0I73_01250 [Shewanella mesophila]|uniref:hypothetical protein n=1 Tax=Shewanella mesophila TaxID=2864208 RepID=UPI001C660C39|nr:hypothetical protein [Shewanella mesophila]QYJ86420.1 hypothetical protein K0I73_01250 [Shewanella mesophila]